MASLAKRRAVRGAGGPGAGAGTGTRGGGSGGAGDSGSGSSGGDSEEELQEEVQIDFEAHTISDSDCNGIKRLLQQLFLKAGVNLTELADIIIQQSYIGSVIRQAEVLDESSEDDDDEDGVFGFITVINLTERMGTESVEQIKDLVLSQCKTHHPMAAEQLEKILNDNSKPVNLLISERFINVPPQIALPLHKQLQAELVDAQKTNKPCGKCHHYLIISKACMEVGKKKPHQRGKQKEDLMFANAEDEFFYEQSIVKFSYSVEEESDSCLSGRWAFDDVPMKPLRVVMLIPADRLNAVMDKLKEYLSV